MYKYNKVAGSIREGILEGRMKPGEKLPSIQSCAKETGYNPDTIIKAYKLLEEEHLIYSVPKSGYYVVKSIIKADHARGGIDLNTVRPPDCINPYKDFYHCMDKSITIYKNKLLEYAPPQGMEELRAVLVKHLMNFQIFTRQQDIFITNGAQQALYILAAMPFPGNGRIVVVEQPTYSVMLKALNCSKVPVTGVSRTSDGIDLKELEAVFQTGDVKFFYTMPRFQNPTGFSYHYKQKQEIIRLACRYGVYIVEDDYLADLEPDEKADSLYAMGEKERTVYIRSFSKTLLPGLRLGLAILPEALKKEFMTYKQSIDLNTPVLTQGALEIYLKSSMYPIHVVRTRKFYKNKMKVLKKACERTFGHEVRYHIPPAGIYAFIETGTNSADKIVNRLLKDKILVSSIKSGCLDGFSVPEGIRLCVCNCTDEELERAVRRIKEEMFFT
ncbi:aminotransferase-like domain-containing protein [Clostridium sp. Marseille-P2415]|uniref:aminotransferase-like domain-containing protein n=1 Tax=Clostridium sp. Marseille-P2415 TaxID=1805471 RepID=UPI001115A160|nr:PLP-dependent aminotransferase family protein [Clostridium sp. Marseille-P2415]